MKVGQNTNVEILASKLQQSAVQQAQHKQSGTAGDAVKASARNAQGVPVTVSNSARSLDQNAKTSGDVDMAKVLAMREAIANGSFRVNAGAVADKLLGDAAQLLSAGRA